MKFSAVLVSLFALSVISLDSHPIDEQINIEFAHQDIKKNKQLHDDSAFEYVLDDKNEFHGLGDCYEKNSPLDNSEAEIYDVYMDGTRKKVNSNESIRLNSISTYKSSNDSFENNDSFDNATIVYKAGNTVGIRENYCSISGTINQKTTGILAWKKHTLTKIFTLMMLLLEEL